MNMLNKITPKLLLAALILTMGSGLVQAQALKPPEASKPAAASVSVPELRKIANQAHLKKNYTAFRQAIFQLHKVRPNNSEYMYQLVLAHALLDEKTEALNIMLQMQQQGLSYDFTQTPDSKNISSTQVFQYLNELMIEAGQPMGNAEPVITLDKEVILPEAIDWDPQREAFLIGTVQSGSIYSVNSTGEKTELVRANNENGIWGIYDVAVDSARNRLWASSASNPQFSGFDPVDKGRSVLLEFDLETFELIKHYPVPVDGRPHSLGNIALAPNGDVYVADSILPVVYVKKANEAKLNPFFASRERVSLRGLAVSDDGLFLYLADYEMGLGVVDLVAGKAFNLSSPETLNLGGIDGLNYWNGSLVIIQNGISPQRILNLKLDPSGRAVSDIAPLAVALEIMDSPNYGTVVGDDFYFFANSHWGYSDERVKPIVIAKTSLADVANIVPPDAKRLMEQYEKAQSEGRVKPAPGQEKADTDKKEEG